MQLLKFSSWATLILVLASGPIAAQQSAAPIDAGRVYKRVSPSVVLIEALNSRRQPTELGSGFLVSSDGRILTNFHVIAHSKEATVRLANGDAYDDVEVLSVDKRKDIALIKIKAVDSPSVTLGRSSSVKVGSTIYSLGNPLGLQNTLSQGLVSGVRQFDGYQYFQISAPISPGSSGGPVLAADGAVIGIAVGSFKGGQNLNFAIPIDYAKGMLSSTQHQPLSAFYEPETQEEDSGTGLYLTTSLPAEDRAILDKYPHLKTSVEKLETDLATVSAYAGEWVNWQKENWDPDADMTKAEKALRVELAAANADLATVSRYAGEWENWQKENWDPTPRPGFPGGMTRAEKALREELAHCR